MPKAKRPITWTCEASVVLEKVVCAQLEYIADHDRNHYHRNTLERPRTSDPGESYYDLVILMVQITINSTPWIIIAPSPSKMLKNNTSLKQTNLASVFHSTLISLAHSPGLQFHNLS